MAQAVRFVMRMAKTITSYRDLIAWQRAMDLAELVFHITATFPSSERFGLSAQMRKAAVSIPSNISEGHRHRGPSYIHHVVIALGSHAELETQALLGHRLTFIPDGKMDRFTAIATQVGELTHGLLRALEAKS